MDVGALQAGADVADADREVDDGAFDQHQRGAGADAEGSARKTTSWSGSPGQAGLMDRWARTSLERSRLYRRVDDAWLESGTERVAGAITNLRIAKLMADHLAQPLPLQICGKPTSGTENPEDVVPPGQLVGYAPLTYTAEFPLDSLPALRRIKGVYWRHQVAGRMVRRRPFLSRSASSPSLRGA